MTFLWLSAFRFVPVHALPSPKSLTMNNSRKHACSDRDSGDKKAYFDYPRCDGRTSRDKDHNGVNDRLREGMRTLLNRTSPSQNLLYSNQLNRTLINQETAKPYLELNHILLNQNLIKQETGIY